MKPAPWILLAVAACHSSGPAVPPTDLYLTVMNVGGHCTITIDNAQPSISTEETIADFEPGQTIALAASATAGFTLGSWHHTAGDTGQGDPGTSSGSESATSVTLGDSPACVWICCASGTTSCPTADPCQ